MTENIKQISQFGQDIEVLNFYKNKKNGFFVEIGASDGKRFSNTYLLEKSFNWEGICSEPIPSIFKRLCKNRPNSKCSDYAVYNESNKEVIFDIASSCSLFSGISNHITTYKKRVDSNKVQIKVKTITLNDLLEKYNAPSFIDYLSIDTEGTEYEILQNVDFEKYTFGLIDVENNNEENKRSLIKEILIKNGYIYLKELGCDDLYKHKSI